MVSPKRYYMEIKKHTEKSKTMREKTIFVVNAKI